MGALIVGLGAAAALLMQAEPPVAAAPSPVVFYDAVFEPLKRGEAQYAHLGPVGPYYPDIAARAGQRGGAVIDCLVLEGGRLSKCKVMAEKPNHSNFGDAASLMAERGRIRVGPEAPVGQVVHVRVIFDLTAKAEVEH
ncbi:MAG: TonB family protein [Phenylobacterium sp.]